MKNNLNVDKSIFYIQEYKNILLTILLFSFTLLLSIVMMSFGKSLFNNDWTIWITFSLTIIFSLFELLKQYLLIINLNKLEKNFSTERSNKYIYINWIKKNENSLKVIFYLVLFLFILMISSITLNSVIASDSLIILYNFLIYFAFISFTLLVFWLNKQRLNTIIKKNSRFMKMEELSDEIIAIKQQAKSKTYIKNTFLLLSIVGIYYINKGKQKK